MTSISLPGSKSITNRALILSSLCENPAILHNTLESDDTKTCMDALVSIKEKKIIDCHDAGTVARFLLPICSAKGGEYIFNGSARLRERPIKPLLNALMTLGISFEYLENLYQFPLKINSCGFKKSYVEIDLKESSQFLSGLLMAAPLTQEGLKIRAYQKIIDKPYVLMTLHLMNAFGIEYEFIDDYTIYVPKGKYKTTTINIEPDASTASYFFGLAALTQKTILVDGLNKNSIQGDLEFLSVLKTIGCRIDFNDDSISVTGIKKLKPLNIIDMSTFSDTFMTLAVIAPFLPTPTTICGLQHTRSQESDRIKAMAMGLYAIGIQTIQDSDSLTIFPGVPHQGIIDPQNDHRIAMSFGILAKRVSGIMINNRECVSKTCPSFFTLLESIGE